MTVKPVEKVEAFAVSVEVPVRQEFGLVLTASVGEFFQVFMQVEGLWGQTGLFSLS